MKVVAVDATQAESLAGKYQIQGFPTIKIFGKDKRSPSDYQGQRTADGIVQGAMKAANQLVKDRKGGGGKSSSSSSSSSSGAGSKRSSGGSKSDVIELTDVNFDALVMESHDQWLVEFFAPWYIFLYLDFNPLSLFIMCLINLVFNLFDTGAVTVKI